MSTLRISNIEAKSVPASATIDEKVKITNSSGDPLVFIDGKTSGITTVGINTTDGNITFDANSNVVVTGIITATKFVGTIEPTNLTVGGDLTIPDKIIHTGDTNTAIRFPAADTVTAETGGTERVRITSAGKVGIDNGSPDNKLSVYDVGYCGLELKSNRTTATDNIGGVHWKTQSTDVAYLQSLVDGTIRFRNTSSLTERFRIASGGQVIIGDDDTDKANGHFDDLIVGANASTTETHGITIVCGNAATNGGIAFSDGSNGGADAYRGMISYQHNDNHMQFRTNAVERLRITSSGDITFTGPDTSFATIMYAGNYTKLDLRGTNIANSNHYMLSYGAGHGSANEFHIVNTVSNLILRTSGSALTIANDKNVTINDGNLILANGHGIDFSATANAGSPSSASSEVFDDYEEGSWTPGLSGSSSVTGQTYSSRSGYYTKIGNRVYCDFSIVIGTKGSYGGTYIQIVNLPFTINGGAYTRSCSTPIYFRTLNQRWCFLGLQQYEGQAKCYIFGVEGPGSGADGASNRSYPNGGDIANGTEMTGSFSYLSA